MGRLWRRIYYLLHRGRLERELAEEMAAHREMLTPDRRDRFGGDLRLREEAREAWAWTWLDEAWQDLAYGARVLWRSPGFTVGAVTVLALGLGANLAEFQIFDAMVFHRLTLRGVESCLQFTHGAKGGQRLGFPSGAYETLRTQNRTLAWLVAEDPTVEMTVDGEAAMRTTMVSPNYFGSLGIVPAWGRLPDEEDSAANAPLAVALGYGYWQTRWGGDTGVIGRTVRINGQPARIVGVLPHDFDGLMPRRTALWLPLASRPLVTPGTVPLGEDFARSSEAFYGRPRPGVSRAAVDGELTALIREIGREHPETFVADERLRAHPVQETLWVRLRQFPALAVFIVMVLLVLVSACANLANMLLARGLARQREIAIRLSIGASRRRIVRQLMTEYLLLALLGAGAGLACGMAFAKSLMYAFGSPVGMRLAMRGSILAGGFALAIVSAALFGLPAALRTVSGDHRRIRLRQRLVGVQVAVSCVLLIASGVLAHNGIASASIDVTFDYRNMVIAYPDLYAQNLSAAAARQKLAALVERVGALPGTAGVTAAVCPPFGSRARVATLPDSPPVYWNAVAESYFELMNAPVVRGRVFSGREENVVVVSESAARAIWPNQDPIGKTWRLSGADRTVVGVVKDSGANQLSHPDSVEAYVPLAGQDLARAALIVRARSDPAAVSRLIAPAAQAERETVSVALMRSSRDNALDAMRKLVTLFGSLGALATGLAAAGMFALVAFAVAQRRKELSIRMAIGAGPGNIVGILLRQNGRAMAAGIVAGIALAAILARLVRGMIPLASPETFDPMGFAAGVGASVVVAALATLMPALRALRIDPAATLREE